MTTPEEDKITKLQSPVYKNKKKFHQISQCTKKSGLQFEQAVAKNGTGVKVILTSLILQ